MPEGDARKQSRGPFARWVSMDRDSPGGVHGVAIWAVRTFLTAYREFLRNFCWERAGTLSFVTIASLIPLSVLFLSFIGIFWTIEQVHGFMEQKLLAYLIPDPATRNSFWDILSKQISTTAFQFQAGVNIAAVVGLLVASLALLVTAERVFNLLWDVEVSRNYFQKLRIFWVILTTSPVALTISLYFDTLLGQGTPLGNLAESSALVAVLYEFLIPVMVSFLAFTILNIFLPNTTVKFWPALLGALTSALLWEGAKRGFYVYVQRASTLSTFYASLAIFPVFFFWVYLTWLIVLFGVEVTRSAQDGRRLAHRAGLGALESALHSAPFLAVYALNRIYAAFGAGAPLPTLDGLAGGIGLSGPTLEAVVARLVARGILVEDAKQPGRYAPTRSPDLVRLREVVEANPEPLLSPDGLSEAGAKWEGASQAIGAFQKARTAFLGSFGEETFRDLTSNNYKQET